MSNNDRGLLVEGRTWTKSKAGAWQNTGTGGVTWFLIEDHYPSHLGSPARIEYGLRSNERGFLQVTTLYPRPTGGHDCTRQALGLASMTLNEKEKTG